jgi:sec-independent protein translocase protein TatA
MDIGSGELVVIALVLLVLLGGAKLPQFARNLGRAKSEFQKGLHGEEQDEDDSRPDEPS